MIQQFFSFSPLVFETHIQHKKPQRKEWIPMEVLTQPTNCESKTFKLKKIDTKDKQTLKIEYIRYKDELSPILFGDCLLSEKYLLKFIYFYEILNAIDFADQEDKESVLIDCHRAFLNFFFIFSESALDVWMIAKEKEYLATREYLMLYFLLHPAYFSMLNDDVFENFIESLCESKDLLSSALFTLLLEDEKTAREKISYFNDKKCLWPYAYLNRAKHLKNAPHYFETLKSSKELSLLSCVMMSYSMIENCLAVSPNMRASKTLWLDEPLKYKVPLAEYLFGVSVYFGIGCKANQEQGKRWMNKALLDEGHKQRFWNHFTGIEAKENL